MLDGSKKKSKIRNNSSPASSSPSTATSINLEEDYVHLELPIGRKAAKAQQKKGKEKKFNLTYNGAFSRISKREKRNGLQENGALWKNIWPKARKAYSWEREVSTQNTKGIRENNVHWYNQHAYIASRILHEPPNGNHCEKS